MCSRRRAAQGREASGLSHGPAWPALRETVESRPVPGRRTVLDALRQPHLAGDSLPVGHYGLSQGGETALRPVAEESRTRAAVPDGA